MKRIHFLGLSAAVLLAGACGGGDSTGPGNGSGGGSATFSASVTGDMEGDISGSAFHGEYTDPTEGTVFELNFNETGGSGHIVLARLSARPGVGAYSVADIASGGAAAGEFVGLVYEGDEENLESLFYSTGGTVTISSSSGSQVKGSFEIDVLGYVATDPETEISLTISGNFNTKSGSVGMAVSSLSVVRK